MSEAGWALVEVWGLFILETDEPYSDTCTAVSHRLKKKRPQGMKERNKERRGFMKKLKTSFCIVC
jgi:hypothetical protein